jgi:hypothetical protein
MARTLKAITGERPRCQYCGKDVQPRTHRVLVLGHLTQVPTIEELRTLPQPEPHYPSVEEAIKWGYDPDRVFRMSRKTNFREEPYTMIHFWTGTYDAWGHQDARWLFCCMECGLGFGLAAWRAGYRMKEQRNG